MDNIKNILSNRSPSRSYTFFQVAGSAVRPLTNIPHCCTIPYWGFFRPNVIDRPLSHDYGILG